MDKEEDSQEVDASSRCSAIESQCVMDYTNEFSTHEVFKSRKLLCDWAREVGKRNGFVVVINKSDVTSKGRTPRLTLGCERGGKYRKRKKDIDIETDGEKKKHRETDTKKCDCPFLLKASKVSTSDEWMLIVECGLHNHPTTKHLEGHSYAGRLSEQENALVVDMSKSMVRPKEILATLKKKDVLNASTMRTIYNARNKYREIERANRSQLQYLLGKLREHKYIEWHRISGENSLTVSDLFWAHPLSVGLLAAFPHVLIMDCTYKTNRYRLPLLEIVGVTSTELTFSVAFVYLQSKQEDNYTWALGKLRSIMEHHNVLPNVIVTDMELALMNAIHNVFPNVRHMLCRWHISRNVLANCKKEFESQIMWEKFITMWNVVVFSATEEAYIENLAILQRQFCGYPSALQYVINNWLIPYNDKFVSAWTDNIRHYGNETINRAESTHTKLKRQLDCSTMNFETSWAHVHNLIELQHTKIKSSFEKSTTVVMHKLKGSEFTEVRGVVSISALDHILAESRRAKSASIDIATCGCANRRSRGLPCAHEISEYIRDMRPIPLDCIDPHWRKLDMKPTLHTDSMDIMMAQAGIELFLDQYRNTKDFDTRRRMLDLLMEAACPATTRFTPPDESNSRTQGTPKQKSQKSTKHDPSTFEYALSAHDSHSPVGYAPILTVSQTVQPVSIRPPKEKVRRLKKTSMSTYLESFPTGLRDYIDCIEDVASDGNCGFRCVANLVGIGEAEHYKVRQDLLDELLDNHSLYVQLYGSADRVRELVTILSHFRPRPSPEHWMTMPDMGHLIASRYEVVLYHISMRQCLTFFPLKSALMEPTSRREIAIGFVHDSHFIQIYLKSGHPVPPIATNWIHYHQPLADGWETAYTDRIQSFKEVVSSDVATNETVVDLD